MSGETKSLLVSFERFNVSLLEKSSLLLLACFLKFCRSSADFSREFSLRLQGSHINPGRPSLQSTVTPNNPETLDAHRSRSPVGEKKDIRRFDGTLEEHKRQTSVLTAAMVS